MACKGSKPQLRGYTCGLWTLFHTITIQAFNTHKKSMNTNIILNLTFLVANFIPSKDVLEPIHKFIVQFLSCEICSKNFDKMATETGLQQVNQAG